MSYQSNTILSILNDTAMNSSSPCMNLQGRGATEPEPHNAGDNCHSGIAVASTVGSLNRGKSTVRCAAPSRGLPAVPARTETAPPSGLSAAVNNFIKKAKQSKKSRKSTIIIDKMDDVKPKRKPKSKALSKMSLAELQHIFTNLAKLVKLTSKGKTATKYLTILQDILGEGDALSYYDKVMKYLKRIKPNKMNEIKTYLDQEVEAGMFDYWKTKIDKYAAKIQPAPKAKKPRKPKAKKAAPVSLPEAQEDKAATTSAPTTPIFDPLNQLSQDEVVISPPRKSNKKTTELLTTEAKAKIEINHAQQELQELQDQYIANLNRIHALVNECIGPCTICRVSPTDPALQTVVTEKLVKSCTELEAELQAPIENENDNESTFSSVDENFWQNLDQEVQQQKQDRANEMTASQQLQQPQNMDAWLDDEDAPIPIAQIRTGLYNIPKAANPTPPPKTTNYPIMPKKPMFIQEEKSVEAERKFQEKAKQDKDEWEAHKAYIEAHPVDSNGYYRSPTSPIALNDEVTFPDTTAPNRPDDYSPMRDLLQNKTKPKSKPRKPINIKFRAAAEPKEPPPPPPPAASTAVLARDTALFNGLISYCKVEDICKIIVAYTIEMEEIIFIENKEQQLLKLCKRFSTKCAYASNKRNIEQNKAKLEHDPTYRKVYKKKIDKKVKDKIELLDRFKRERQAEKALKRSYIIKAEAEPILEKEDKEDTPPPPAIPVGNFTDPCSVDELDELTRRRMKETFAASEQQYIAKLQSRQSIKYIHKQAKKVWMPKFYEEVYLPQSPKPSKSSKEVNVALFGGMRRRRAAMTPDEFGEVEEATEAERLAEIARRQALTYRSITGEERRPFAPEPREEKTITTSHLAPPSYVPPSTSTPVQQARRRAPPPIMTHLIPIQQFTLPTFIQEQKEREEEAAMLTSQPEEIPMAPEEYSRLLAEQIPEMFAPIAEVTSEPLIPLEPVKLTKKEIWQARKAYLRAEDEDKTNTDYAQRLQNARLMNYPPYSRDIMKVYQHTVNIRTGEQHITTVGVKFNFPTVSIMDLAIPLVRRFREYCNGGLQGFIETILEARMQMWKFQITTESDAGQYTRSSTFHVSFRDALNYICSSLQSAVDKYEESNLYIVNFEVIVIKSMLAGSASDYSALKRKLDEKLGDLQTDWYIINPKSKTNCLWTACAIGRGYQANSKLLYDKVTQNKAGAHLKQKTQTRNYRGGQGEDVQKIADYIKFKINVRDQTNSIIFSFDPSDVPAGQPVECMNILNMYGHFYTLISKDDTEAGRIYMNNQKEIEQGCVAIEVFEKELEPKRIVVYDIETYKTPIRTENGIEVEFEQTAYAIAWAFVCKNAKEKDEAIALGYQIESYEWDTVAMDVAYKIVDNSTPINFDGIEVDAPNCLDQAIDAWSNEEFFHNAVLYGHNGGKFDIRIIMGQSKLLYSENLLIVADKTIELNGRLINLEIVNHAKNYDVLKGKVIYHSFNIRDSLPLFGPGSSLAKLCKELNVPHKKMEELVGIHDKQYAHTWYQNWIEHDLDLYLKYDILGLLEVLIKFNAEVYEGTGIPITAVNTGASLAKKYYLKEYYKPYSILEDGSKVADMNKAVYTLTPDFDSFIRAGYGGGRCEAFVSAVIRDKLYYYDFTSLYPDVGRNDMPVGSPQYVVDPEHELEETNKAMIARIFNRRVLQKEATLPDENKVMFWKVRVRSPLAAAGTPLDHQVRKPLFGHKENGMYLFRWYSEWQELVIYEPEIVFALEHGLDYIFEPINAVEFYKAPILRECMENLFIKKAEAKREGKAALSKSWKIIINSLYGVWGLKILDREGIEIAKPEFSNWAVDLASEKLIDINQIGEYIITRRNHDLEVKDCNVAIAAAVTSEARMKLYRLFVSIQDKGGKIIYCDTDSIITNYCIEEDRELQALWMGPSNGEDLGSLKNEIVECYEKHKDLAPKYYFDKAVIVAPKLYIVCAEQEQIIKKAHKGYREDATNGDMVTFDKMAQLVDKDHLSTPQRKLQNRTLQWLGGNGDILKGKIGVKNVRRDKNVKQIIRKGIPDQQGDIKPFISIAQIEERDKAIKSLARKFKV